MNTTRHMKVATKPVRHIAITGISSKSCKRIKMLLKNTSYYCVVDCYKSGSGLKIGETFYLPDYIILDIRSVISLLFLKKRIEGIKELIPDIKIILYYSIKRYPLLQSKIKLYPEVYTTDEEQDQLAVLETALKVR